MKYLFVLLLFISMSAFSEKSLEPIDSLEYFRNNIKEAKDKHNDCFAKIAVELAAKNYDKAGEVNDDPVCRAAAKVYSQRGKESK